MAMRASDIDSEQSLGSFVCNGGTLILPSGIKIIGDIENAVVRGEYLNAEGEAVTLPSKALEAMGLDVLLLDAETVERKGLCKAPTASGQVTGEISEFRAWLKEKANGKWGTDLSSALMDVFFDAFEEERLQKASNTKV